MEDLSNIHEYATERTNVTGVVSPILEFQPDDGLALRIANMVARGAERGVPIYAKLQDSGGNDLPLGTSLRWEFEGPGDDERRKVSSVRDNIQPYRNLTIQDQQDEDYVDATKIVLGGPELTVRDVDVAYLSVESSAQIDWANSQLYVEGSAVEEVPIR